MRAENRFPLFLIPLFCNGRWFVNLFLRRPAAGSLFCPGSAQGRHLMGLDEDEAGQSSYAWSQRHGAICGLA